MRDNWLVKIGTVICPICGKETDVFNNNPRKKCCSKKCSRRKWFLENKEHENNYAKKWYQENRDSEILKNKEYRDNNRELFDWYHDKHRFSGNKTDILKRDGNHCVVCNSEKRLSIHHKDGKGYHLFGENANNVPANLITLCSSCHTKLHHFQRKNNIILLDNKDIMKTLMMLNKRHEIRKKCSVWGFAHSI